MATDKTYPSGLRRIGGGTAESTHTEHGIATPDSIEAAIQAQSATAQQAVADFDERLTALEAGGGGGSLSARVQSGILIITDEDAVVTTQVTATDPTFTDLPGTTSDTYTIPTKTGVEYLVGGVVVAAGTYPGTGAVTVTAQATTGYELTGASSWSHTFSTAVATYADEVMADTPAAYYPLSDAASPAVDATGRTSQATIEGVTFGALSLGDGATSADFSGATATTGLSTSPDADLVGVMTVEALVRFDTVGTQQRAVLGVNDGAGTERLVLRASTTGKPELVFFDDSGTAKSATGTTTLVAGVTYHLAGYITAASGLRVFLNGISDGFGTLADALPMAIASPVLSIGFRKGEGSFANNLDGKIAGVAVYATQLPEARILAHAQAAGVA